jgi:bacteriocin biosynthesis cyclodehydratase domain-containing protein
VNTTPVEILTVGVFGRAVAEYLIALRRDVHETRADGADRPFDARGAARIRLLAAWRPVPAICELLDHRSHASQRPFVPLIAESTVLRLGPIVVPGRGACWSCWMRRRRQHAEWPDELMAVLRHYADSDRAGPEGYLEPFAMIGAMQLAQTIEAIDASAPVAGRVCELDMLTRNIAVSTVVGVHDCPRCGLHRSPLTRSVAEMAQQLEHIWAGSLAPEDSEARRTLDAALARQ